MLISFTKLLVLAVTAVASVRATGAGMCFQVGVPNPFCVYGSPVKNVQDMVEIRYEIPQGLTWAALGVGSSMQSADIMFVNIDANGTAALTRRTASGFFLPPLATAEDLTLVPAASGQFTVNNAPTTVVTFIRSKTDPANSNPLTAQPQSFIWAALPGSPGGALNQHQFKGTTTGNFLDGSLAFTAGAARGPLISGSGANYDTLIHAHGILMAVGWLVMAPLGVYVARFGKAAFGVWWFRIHIALLLVGAVGGTYAGFGLVYSAISQNGGVHFSTTDSVHGAHVIIGLILLILTAPQAILGFIIDKLWVPTRRLVVLLALVNIPLGINTYDNLGSWAYIVYGVWLGAVVLGGFFLQIRNGQTVPGPCRIDITYLKPGRSATVIQAVLTLAASPTRTRVHTIITLGADTTGPSLSFPPAGPAGVAEWGLPPFTTCVPVQNPHNIGRKIDVRLSGQPVDHQRPSYAMWAAIPGRHVNDWRSVALYIDFIYNPLSLVPYEEESWYPTFSIHCGRHLIDGEIRDQKGRLLASIRQYATVVPWAMNDIQAQKATKSHL
ncbi:hypothetical protein BDK51DRAFT_29297 [Blyttiomyces helicus]|uniref:Cytochrome b561 domain-containing protein n=1 Tax=Blyttiomyces helicus TaxID=388810 RepID=A0A4P9WMT1_9FUNG|nr:hypothetical protein BDK51DRAFT_29297 [Blyttiomyces helicus]|eukprot:RKO92500.1 hypothetical protein BDK51DRAFT_29297 [Blyttiomyces helicus]